MRKAFLKLPGSLSLLPSATQFQKALPTGHERRHRTSMLCPKKKHQATPRRWSARALLALPGSSLGYEACFTSAANKFGSQLWLIRRDMKSWSIKAASQDEAAGKVSSWQGTLLRTFKVIAALAFGSLLLLAALPSILSTSVGSSIGCSIASRFVPGDISVEHADLGWSKKVNLRNVALRSPSILGRERLAAAGSLRTSATLWSIANGAAFDIFAEKAWIDSSLAPTGRFKWGQLLDYASGKLAGPNRAHQYVEHPGLVAETEDVAFTAEGRFLAGSLYGSGLMRIPKEVKEIIGKDLHLAAIVGASNLEDAKEDLGLDLSWTAQPSEGKPRQGAGGGVDSASKQTIPNRVLPGEPILRSKGEPTMLSIRSQHMDVEASGWRLANGDLVLRKPARAVLEFTPALAEYGLGRLSPLLSGVLAVEEGKVSITVMPELSTLPAETYHARVEPLRIAINRQDLLAKAIEFLRLKEGREISQTSLLQGITSAINVDIDKDGGVETHRVDLLVSADGGKTGLHLCTWGSVNPVSNEVDLSLGFPASTLAMIGLRCGRESDMLVIPVSGKTSSMKVSWTEAYRRLASLAAQQAGKTVSLRGKLLHGVIQALDLRANAPGLTPDWEPPEPSELLPWKQDSSILRNVVEVDDSTVKDPGGS